MTAIAGFVHEGKVWIGGDSAGVDGRFALTVRADQKVFRSGEFVMGFTSSFRMGQLLRYTLTVPPWKEKQDLFEYMVNDFIGAVRNCLKAGGYAEKHDDAERGGTFLVGVRGRLFCIQSDYQVSESADGYEACGCGELICSGALFATRNFIGPPVERMKVVLEAAERHSAGVRAPFHILSTEVS